jgi:carbon-monoxide dehydrogenase medium subunit
MLRRDLHVHRAGDIDEALALLGKYGDDAALYAGGTELVLVLKLGLSSVEHLVDVRGIPELSGVDVAGGTTLRIGAATTHWEVSNAPLVRAGCPALAAMERTVGNLRVQTTGTLGGNLCFADPQSDPATFLVAAGGSVVCASAGGQRRTIAVEAFLVDAYSTALQERQELLESVHVPLPVEGGQVVHRKLAFGERPDVTCAAVVNANGGRVHHARVVVGSVTGRPVVLGTAAQLAGLPLAEATAGAPAFAEACVDEISERMLEDKRTPYGRSLTRTLLQSVVEEALGAAGDRPD